MRGNLDKCHALNSFLPYFVFLFVLCVLQYVSFGYCRVFFLKKILENAIHGHCCVHVIYLNIVIFTGSLPALSQCCVGHVVATSDM
jgi:hypothetical protein